MWTVNFQMFKLVLEKAEEPEIKLPISAESSKKQESSRKTSTSALLTTPKPLTVWITINCGKFWKRWEYQTTWPASWETCMQVKKQQTEPDVEQQTGSKSGKECVKAVYCHPAYLTYMQSTSWEMLSRLIIAFLPKSKCLLISWLQSPSAVILEPPKIKSATVSTVSPSIAIKWWDQMPWS